jgi:hypothetical protein
MSTKERPSPQRFHEGDSGRPVLSGYRELLEKFPVSVCLAFLLPLITLLGKERSPAYRRAGSGLEFAGRFRLREIENNMAQFDQPAESPFVFSECFILPKPIGRTAQNLRELLEALREVHESVLHYHLWQFRMAISHPSVEYPNDFAYWADMALQDRRLTEKLSALDPFDYENTEQVRDALVDLLEEYLWDLPYVPWVRPELAFHLIEASTVVLHSRFSCPTLPEFCSTLEKVGLDSIYFHMIDARWRLRAIKMNDFSSWIKNSYGLPDLASAIHGIDVSLYTLDEVRRAVINLCSQVLKKDHEQTE